MTRQHRRDIIDEMAALSTQERADVPADEAQAQRRADSAREKKARAKRAGVIADVIEGIVEFVIDMFT